MKKGGPLEIKETAFKASAKGKEKEDLKESGYISEEDEVNIVKKLQQGSGIFRGKLPSKCLANGRVGHYAAQCHHEKGNVSIEGNRRSYDTYEDSDGLSNSDEDDQAIKIIMAYENDTLEKEDILK